MSLKQRVTKIELSLNIYVENNKINSNEEIINMRLMESNNEYRECWKQLFCLQHNVNQSLNKWHDWGEPYSTEAEKILIAMVDIWRQNRTVII